ncbi:MAG: DUF2283 domain-containing protein [Phycisphaeraceae bacterium]|nr:DUF2283 domain-containing protein [Phycisphaeraceae bacterium]
MEARVIPDFLPAPDKLRFRENAARMVYDTKHDSLRLQLSNAKVVRRVKADPAVVLEYDDLNNLVGVQVLKASKRVTNPQMLAFAVA